MSRVKEVFLGNPFCSVISPFHQRLSSCNYDINRRSLQHQTFMQLCVKRFSRVHLVFGHNSCGSGLHNKFVAQHEELVERKIFFVTCCPPSELSWAFKERGVDSVSVSFCLAFEKARLPHGPRSAEQDLCCSRSKAALALYYSLFMFSVFLVNDSGGTTLTVQHVFPSRSSGFRSGNPVLIKKWPWGETWDGRLLKCLLSCSEAKQTRLKTVSQGNLFKQSRSLSAPADPQVILPHLHRADHWPLIPLLWLRFNYFVTTDVPGKH